MFEKCDIRNSSKLNISNGAIHYKMYLQTGDMIDMSLEDTLENRLFVSWVQIHDRYTDHGDEETNPHKG